jgi:hypothetical protein
MEKEVGEVGQIRNTRSFSRKQQHFPYMHCKRFGWNLGRGTVYPEEYLDEAMTASFQILSNSSIILSSDAITGSVLK